jgi:hypothetical protein
MLLTPDDPWLTHIPLLHRILAGGAAASAYPPIPRGDDIHDYCAYWEPLYYLLNSILGWTDLGQGLGWWYSNGKSDHGDQSLSIMKQIWDTDHQIDFFTAWAWQEGQQDFTLENAAHTSAFRNESWWREFRRRGQPYSYDPFHGGTNALHLGHSEWAWQAGDATPDSLHVDAAKRHVVLIAHDFTTWRGELVNAGRTLPPLADDRSWHVDVFDKRVGWLGSYRRSRMTGRWFAGRHSVHMAGQ